MIVDFDDKASAAALAERVEFAGKLGSDASVSFSGGKQLFFYGPTAAALRRGAATLRSEADALGVTPANVRVGEWMPDESRWSDEAPRQGERTAGVVTGIVGELFDRF